VLPFFVAENKMLQLQTLSMMKRGVSGKRGNRGEVYFFYAPDNDPKEKFYVVWRACWGNHLRSGELTSTFFYVVISLLDFCTMLRQMSLQFLENP